MATHSSALAWKIPWMEEPGGLQSMGSRRVRHYWATSLSLFTFLHWRRKWQPTPVFLPGESQGQRGLVGCRLWGCRVGHDCRDLAAMLSWGEKWCLWVGSHLWMCSCAWQCLEAWGISHKNSLFLYSEKMRLSGHPASTFFYDGCALDLGCGLCPF